jgi:hypothetical protein
VTSKRGLTSTYDAIGAPMSFATSAIVAITIVRSVAGRVAFCRIKMTNSHVTSQSQSSNVLFCAFLWPLDFLPQNQDVLNFISHPNLAFSMRFSDGWDNAVCKTTLLSIQQAYTTMDVADPNFRAVIRMLPDQHAPQMQTTGSVQLCGDSC